MFLYDITAFIWPGAVMLIIPPPLLHKRVLSRVRHG